MGKRGLWRRKKEQENVPEAAWTAGQDEVSQWNRLPNSMLLHLDAGAVLQDAPNRRFFPAIELRWVQKRLPRWVCAMLNAFEAGEMFWGVDTDRRVTGLCLDRKAADEILLSATAALRRLSPALDPKQFDVRIVPVHGAEADRPLLVLHFTFLRWPPAPTYSLQGKVYRFDDQQVGPVAWQESPAQPTYELGEQGLELLFGALGRYRVPAARACVPLAVFGCSPGDGVTTYFLGYAAGTGAGLTWTTVVTVPVAADTGAMREGFVRTPPGGIPEAQQFTQHSPPELSPPRGQPPPTWLVRLRWINWSGSPEHRSEAHGVAVQCRCRQCCPPLVETAVRTWEGEFVDRTDQPVATEAQMADLFFEAKQAFEEQERAFAPVAVEYANYVLAHRPEKKRIGPGCPAVLPVPLIRKKTVLKSEDSRTEYKGYVLDRARVSRILNGFLNSHGGDLFLGVTDSCKVLGVALDQRAREELEKEVVFTLGTIRPVPHNTHVQVQVHPVRSEADANAADKLKQWWVKAEAVEAGTAKAAAEPLFVVQITVTKPRGIIYFYSPMYMVSRFPGARTGASFQQLTTENIVRRLDTYLHYRTLKRLAVGPRSVGAAGAAGAISDEDVDEAAEAADEAAGDHQPPRKQPRLRP